MYKLNFQPTLLGMTTEDPLPAVAGIRFEGDSLELLFRTRLNDCLGFSLRQLQIGRQPTSQTRSMRSIGAGVFELKESDERTWYRAIYLSKIGSVIHVLHCFEKDSRKTDRRDIQLAKERYKRVMHRLKEQKRDARK